MSHPKLSELTGQVLHHLHETTRDANAPAMLDVEQLASAFGSTEAQVRKALEVLENSGHAEVRIYLNNQVAARITAEGELAVEKATTSTLSKPEIKTTHAVAKDRIRELRHKLGEFVDVPVNSEVDLELFQRNVDAWVTDVKETLGGIFGDERIITDCLRPLGRSQRVTDHVRSAFFPTGLPKAVHERADEIRSELSSISTELEQLTQKLVLFSRPKRRLTEEEKRADAFERLLRFGQSARTPKSLSHPPALSSAPKNIQPPLVPPREKTDMTTPQPTQKTERNPKEVFVIYGRNVNAVTEMRRFPKAVGLEMKSFDRHSAELGANPSIDEIINRAVESAKAVIVLVTPDEYIALRPDLRSPHDKSHEYIRWGPRPNVIYEAGLAMAKNRAGTIFVSLGNAELPSDIGGIHIVRLSDRNDARKLLFDKLKSIGCPVDETTEDWRTTELGGNFANCLPPQLNVGDPFTLPGNTK